MEDLGAPIAYLALAEGTPVYDAGGTRLGEVAHVLAAEDQDIFDGLVLDTHDGHRFADGPDVDAIHERGVVLKAGATLHEPPENPAVVGAQPDDVEESDLTRSLRRAWDWVSGRY
ncbi:MAG: hypothetical protein HZB46_04270 [Solirubrobacterales bacterium]|nr:hypothetical protein [Solirubrobacterales bacterium]